MANEKKTIEDELFLIGWVLLAIGGVIAGVYFGVVRRYLPEVPCFFLKLFGLYCPGCGGTRAFMALAKGQVLQSLWYHPLVLYGAIVGGGFLLTQTLERLGVKKVRGWKYHNWYMYGMIIIVVCNFLLKNLLKLMWGITI